jgi:hypothetical protein
MPAAVIGFLAGMGAAEVAASVIGGEILGSAFLAGAAAKGIGLGASIAFNAAFDPYPDHPHQETDR